MPFQVSPGVNVTEVDLTTVIPAVSTSAGGFVGNFNWGPGGVVTTVDSADTLVTLFGRPDTNTAIDFFSAANFLDYTNNLQLVRAVASDSFNASSNATNGLLVLNDDTFDTIKDTNVDHFVVAKHPGNKGNGLQVEICDNADAFLDWTSNTLFDGPPGNSAFMTGLNTTASANDEMHVVVKDTSDAATTGGFSGINNSVLERFAFVSKAANAKDDSGNVNYFKDVINRTSSYIRIIDPTSPDGPITLTNWGSSGTSSMTFGINAIRYANTLSNGVTGLKTGLNDELTSGYTLLADADKVDVSLIITGAHACTVVNHAIDNVAITRKDCVTFLSPDYAEIVGVSSEATKLTNVLEHRNSDINKNTSYAFMDSGWKYQYDRYNDVYRWIPTNADVAGLCARTDNQRDAWWSPAGYNRGQIKNVVKLAYNPTQAHRDQLYQKQVNPIVTFTGEGTMLFGDKTMQTRPSAFDRLNVRRLFIVLEKAISTAAKFSLFEFNDEFTRSQFRNMVEPFLRDVKGRRGITDFKVVCDETNNTGQVIDTNRFIGDIYIKPSRSINFIQLNFVAVASGVDFSEVVGKF